MSDCVVRLENVTKRFDHHVVHHPISLCVMRGEILGLVGGSGSGKTTLLREMLGLLPPTTGEVYLFEERLGEAAEHVQRQLRDRCGVLFQGGALFSALDVFDNIAFPVRELGLDEALIAELVRMQLGMVSLDAEAAHLMPAELSGGMVTRVALARALALQPELLFLDEPTSGLDPVTGQEFVELVASLHRELGFSVVMITHDLLTVRDLCDKVAVLADQQLVAFGPLETVLGCSHPYVMSFFHGERGRRLLRGGT